jgi:hypothetical protein
MFMRYRNGVESRRPNKSGAAEINLSRARVGSGDFDGRAISAERGRVRTRRLSPKLAQMVSVPTDDDEGVL